MNWNKGSNALTRQTIENLLLKHPKLRTSGFKREMRSLFPDAVEGPQWPYFRPDAWEVDVETRTIKLFYVTGRENRKKFNARTKLAVDLWFVADSDSVTVQVTLVNHFTQGELSINLQEAWYGDLLKSISKVA